MFPNGMHVVKYILKHTASTSKRIYKREPIYIIFSKRFNDSKYWMQTYAHWRGHFQPRGRKHIHRWARAMARRWWINFSLNIGQGAFKDNQILCIGQNRVVGKTMRHRQNPWVSVHVLYRPNRSERMSRASKRMRKLAYLVVVGICG